MAVGNNISNIYKMTVGGKTFQVDPASQGGYIKAYNQYEADRKAQLDATQKQLDKTLAQNNATTNANYDNNARQAYVDYMRKQRALPSQLQALGVRGGATESGLLNLYNNYGVEHAANEQQRAAELGSNRNSRDDAYQSAYQAYLADLNEQKQKAIANQINEYNNEITRFSSSVAQYPTTQAGYEAYQAWINNMAASNDPLKDIKVALIRQQMATQFPDGSPDGGDSGSGGGYGGGGYGGYSNSGYDDNVRSVQTGGSLPSPNATTRTAQASWLVRNIANTAASAARRSTPLSSARSRSASRPSLSSYASSRQSGLQKYASSKSSRLSRYGKSKRR